MGGCLSVPQPKPKHKHKHRHRTENSDGHHRQPRESQNVVLLTPNGWERKKRHKKRRREE
ncbi:hypothetical protein HYE67_008721 [Fusarium culmorum]|uniref:Uncharacterized protein n=1 Tax=Fusarium culmorum TaxID=5516 RepID=A0A7S8HZE1_FUSCU|nr:hypothetical protein HYE67_008721 [Fusarium culmorum]